MNEIGSVPLRFEMMWKVDESKEYIKAIQS